ncbi:MAG: SUMF1/EgtB/PvdO family nonheme iron enzyme [Gammaproteobacteria bacterium]|nr:SUMF1/EgtB/PvdO family nonheme iron enzyme [Gammaproteobacteria bacterium]
MQTLRALAADYAEGRIDRKTFITERRRLIDGIVAGEIPLPEEAPPAAPPPQAEGDEDITVDVAEQSAEPVPAAAPTAVAPRKSGRGAGIAVALGIAAALAFGAKQFLAPTTPATTAAPATNVAAQPSLVARFIAGNHWDETALLKFTEQWQALPEAERKSLRGTPAMSQLSDLLQTRFNEARALLELGDRDGALATQRRLLELAQALEISNERIDRMAAEWRVAIASPVKPGAAKPVAAATAPAPAATAPTVADAPAAAAPAEAVPDAAPAPTAATPVEAPPPVAAPSEASKALEPKPAATEQAAPESAAEGPSSPGCSAALATQRRPYCRDKLGNGTGGPLLAVVPHGAYTMGGRRPEEAPRHRVDVARAFAMSVFEVSTADFAAFCKAAGAGCPAQPWNEARLPAVNVPWKLAAAYAEWLSAQTHAHYRLPSEAEWEYAARAGTDTEYPFGDELLPTHARFSFQGPQTMPLAADDRSVNKNRFRLYHMVGNVREWVADAWNAGYVGASEEATARTAPESGPHVVRGGSYADPAERLRSAARGPGADEGDAFTGIRLVRDLQTAP